MRGADRKSTNAYDTLPYQPVGGSRFYGFGAAFCSAVSAMLPP
jgi:hypothetical protein